MSSIKSLVTNGVKLFAGFILLLVLVIGAVKILTIPKYHYEERNLPQTFDEYYSEKLEESKRLNVRPGNEERLVRKTAGKSRVAILYIHGFSASRAEGEYIVDRLADSLEANTYYLRLPGHGANAEDHASVSFKDYLDESEDALRMVQQLGDKIILIGTSMGGLVATYLAAENPDLVSQLILCSPFYDYANSTGKLLAIPGTLSLIQWMDGPYRNAQGSAEWQKKKQPGYENYWLTKYKYQALQSLEELREFVARPEIFDQVKCPVLMLYYYKDEQHQDGAASVKAMLEAFDHFQNPANEKVAIAGGDHVMTSRYVRTDKEAVFKVMLDFRTLAQ